MNIKVRLINGAQPLEIIKKGDWIDLRANEDVELPGLILREGAVDIYARRIPLGIAMELPAGYEAIMAPRSSTFKTFGIISWNSIGVIDNTYCGNNDEWSFGAISLRKTMIKKGDRICQFRIQLSQKATFWQKLKWLFTSKIEVEYVDQLLGPDRHGFGAGTGLK